MEKCKNCGAEMPKKKKTLKIKELGIEITAPEKWTKPYNEIVKPKGWRLPQVWELFQIHESKHKDFIFGEEGYLNFACEQLSIDKGKKWSRWLYRYGSDELGAWGDNLRRANEDGRVCFVRERKWIKK